MDWDELSTRSSYIVCDDKKKYNKLCRKKGCVGCNRAHDEINVHCDRGYGCWDLRFCKKIHCYSRNLRFEMFQKKVDQRNRLLRAKCKYGIDCPNIQMCTSRHDLDIENEYILWRNLKYNK